MPQSLSDKKLSRLLIFQGVNPATIRTWIDSSHIIHLHKGETLVAPHKGSDALYVILDGSADVYLDATASSPISCIARGECVGELAAFAPLKTSTRVIAAEPMSALAIPRNNLLNMVDNSNQLARNLLFLLASRVRASNEIVSHSRQLQQEYENHAKVDVLTGLYNRRWIDEYFERTLGRDDKPEQQELVILMADIDYFKKFNDNYGHLAGDGALACVANALKESVRPADFVARYGGEEFLVILPNTNSQQAQQIAQRVLEGVHAYPITALDQSYPAITISIGIAQLSANDTFDSLVEKADQALYEAKNNGRNRYETSI